MQNLVRGVCCESLINRIEAFPPFPHTLKVQDIVLLHSSEFQHSCLETISSFGSQVGSFVMAVARTGVNLLWKFIVISGRTQIFLESCKTVYDFWCNPYNRSALEKVNALTNALFVGMQIKEIHAIISRSPNNNVKVTFALSLAASVGNTILKIINKGNLLNELIEINKKISTSANFTFMLDQELLKQHPKLSEFAFRLEVINNIQETYEQVKNVPQVKALSNAVQGISHHAYQSITNFIYG